MTTTFTYSTESNQPAGMRVLLAAMLTAAVLWLGLQVDQNQHSSQPSDSAPTQPAQIFPDDIDRYIEAPASVGEADVIMGGGSGNYFYQ